MKSATTFLIMISLSAVALSQEITITDLAGKKVSAAVEMRSHSRNRGRDFHGETRMKWELSFGAGGAISGEQSRVYRIGGEVKGQDTRKIKGTIGKPGEYAEGHSVWILAGSALTRLSTTDTGAFRTTITFAKVGERWTCKAANVMAREVGKGDTRQKGVASGAQGTNIEIVSLKQLSSSCTVTGP